MIVFILLTLTTDDLLGASTNTPWANYGPVLIAPYPKKKDYYLVYQPKPHYRNSSYAPQTTIEVFKSMELPSDQKAYATESATIIAKNVENPEKSRENPTKTQPDAHNDFLLRPETLAGFRALFPENSKTDGNESEGVIFTNDKFLGPVFKAKQINIFVDDPGIVHVMSKRFKTPMMAPPNFKPTETNQEDNGSFIKGLNIFKKIYNSF